MEMGLHSQLLHRLLPGGPYRRPLHVPVQKRADPELLPPQRLDDAEGVPDGLRQPRRRKTIGEKLIQAELENIPKEKVKEICKDHLEKIEQGIRDFRF